MYRGNNGYKARTVCGPDGLLSLRARVFMKADQVVVRLRSGAGGRAWRWRTLPTV
jgi:hypothetical protein